MFKYTPHFLKKLEDILKSNNYELRYEKGNFKSGFCILEQRNVIVVNKFTTVESRINSLIEILYLLNDVLLEDRDKIDEILKKAGKFNDEETANRPAEEV
ncbi:MAG TPA: hypothetical protein PKH65_07805 [Bacteroidia bacterium]|nr:hypothetical protein [Bacteroidia bacterium]HNT80569.1 hypothetical protein [Bacteroidia bacterium]